MTNVTKKVVLASMAATGLVALLAILDLAMGIPFRGQMVMDILFLVAAAIVGYMCYDTYRELA